MNISSFDEMSRIGSLLRIILTVLSNPLIHHCWQPADTPLSDTTVWPLSLIPYALYRPLPLLVKISIIFMILIIFDHFRSYRCTRTRTTVPHQGPHRLPVPITRVPPHPGTTTVLVVSTSVPPCPAAVASSPGSFWFQHTGHIDRSC